MEYHLDAVELRVLGCLIEKELATPDYYPLSLNALINACNQKSNRDPVVTYDEEMVIAALKSLREKKLVWKTDVSRVSKYEEQIVKTLNLVKREAAVLCVLLLRGPQTVGELRSRSERMYHFDGLGGVSRALTALAELDLAYQCPRQPGQKESRFAHGLGSPDESESDQEHPVTSPPEPLCDPSPPLKDDPRIVALEEQVVSLSAKLDTLKGDFEAFKRQFE